MVMPSVGVGDRDVGQVHVVEMCAGEVDVVKRRGA
jgi:hypothetical protein